MDCMITVFLCFLHGLAVSQDSQELLRDSPLKKSSHQFIYHWVRPERWCSTGPTGRILWRPRVSLGFERAGLEPVVKEGG